MPIDQTPVIDWRAIAPVLALTGGGVLALMMIAVRSTVRKATLAAVALVAIALTGYFTVDLAGERIVGMQGMIVIDGVSLFVTMILLIAAAITVPMSYSYLEARGGHRAEYYPLLLFATAGMVLFAMANDLILVFIALEVLSLSLYVMVGYSREEDGAQEAALKYFLLGSLSSAILLYGVALLFGATATTNLSRIAEVLASGSANERLVLVSMGLIAVGFAFKVAAVPFHMWTPDVYQGAPTSVTAFMAAGTKAAAFGALLRVFLVGFGAQEWDWRPVLWVLAIATMIVGSLIAIVQTDVKRMLAYSAISHAGFILVGTVAASADGVAGSLFYLLIYAVMTLGAFAALMASAPGGAERSELSSWAGLGQRHPVFAGAMTLFLLSLAGIPPTAGFMGKFFVFQAAIEEGETALVIAGVVISVIASFFYLRLVVLMWLHDPAEDAAGIGLSTPAVVTLAASAITVLVVGVWPQPLMDLARTAAIFTG